MNLFYWQVFAALFLIGCSIFFAAAETALVSLSRPRIKKLIAQRPALATALTEWLAAPQYLLTTILIGNTLSNVLATLIVSDLAISALPRHRHGVVETSTWLGMTALLFVFGDFVPKSLARHYPQRVTLASIRWLSALSRWATPAIRWSLGVFEKLFPVLEGAPVGRLSVYSLEEIREMIRASAVQGTIPSPSTQMMEKALALNRLPVSQVMTPFERVEKVNLGHDPDQVLDEVAETAHTRVPVYRADPRKIGGYLHVKDILLVWRGALPLQLDRLVRQPLKVAPAMLASDLLEEFRKGGAHLAAVSDAEGYCQGIATLEDVLEEIVGEILDEYDLSRQTSSPP